MLWRVTAPLVASFVWLPLIARGLSGFSFPAIACRSRSSKPFPQHRPQAMEREGQREQLWYLRGVVRTLMFLTQHKENLNAK
jgi:hypothetical protein